MFRFLVGKHQQPMMIHTAFVAEQSLALRSLVSGFMEEAKTGTAIWKDVEEDTFTLFAQFGDCIPPSCNTIENPPAVPTDDAPPEEPMVSSATETHIFSRAANMAPLLADTFCNFDKHGLASHAVRASLANSTNERSTHGSTPPVMRLHCSRPHTFDRSL